MMIFEKFVASISIVCLGRLLSLDVRYGKVLKSYA